MWARHWIPDEICIQGFTTMRQRIRDPFFCCRALGWNWTWHAYELVMPHPKRKKQTKKKHNFQNVWSLENKITYCKKTHVLHFDDFHLLKYVSPYFSGKLFTVDKQILFLKWVLQPCSTTNFFLNFSKWLWTICLPLHQVPRWACKDASFPFAASSIHPISRGAGRVKDEGLHSGGWWKSTCNEQCSKTLMASPLDPDWFFFRDPSSGDFFVP